ncbi:MAG TPA: hypothetical protein VGB98_25580 [Pyrinomonadaceae bacterium]
MKKTMDFILEQQAQLTTTVDRLSVKVDRNAETATALLAIAEIQAAEIRDLTESTRALAERQREADERQREADERQREADERGRRTDERLNVLINIVERHISEGHHGKA